MQTDVIHELTAKIKRLHTHFGLLNEYRIFLTEYQVDTITDILNEAKVTVAGFTA